MRKSFTLIEILLSIAIFSIVVGIALDLFIFSLKIQRENLTNQYLLDQANYVLEYISRQLRMVKKDENHECVEDPNYNYFLVFSGGIKFKDHTGFCQTIFLDEGRIKLNRSGVILPITSDDFEVTEFYANSIEKDSTGNNVQPRATVSFKIKKIGSQKEFLFQTTVSIRKLNI